MSETPLKTDCGSLSPEQQADLLLQHLLSKFQVGQIQAALSQTRITLSELKIRTKEASVIPLVPNPIQAALLDDCTPHWRDGRLQMRGVQRIVLKARQHGVTTLLAGLFVRDCVVNPHTTSVILAHREKDSQRIFQIVTRYAEHLEAAGRCKIVGSSKDVVAFDNGSEFFVDTAGAKNVARGGTIQNFLGSEVAFWPDPEQIVAGALQAVPRDGNIFFESTANGAAGFFHEQWQAAEQGRTRMRPMFFPWFLNPDYTLPSKRFTPTEEERIIQERYRLSDDQMAWFREKEDTLGDTRPQEYPLNSFEAFLTAKGQILKEFVPLRAPQGVLCRDFVPPKEWKHILVIDPGWHVTCGLFGALDTDERLWIYACHYMGEARADQHVGLLDAVWQGVGSPPITVLMDPAGFSKRRTDTGHEHPSWADEIAESCARRRITWLTPLKADNSDPLAGRCRRLLKHGKLLICESVAPLRTEAANWRMPDSGREIYGDRDTPVSGPDHAIDCMRYMVNYVERNWRLRDDYRNPVVVEPITSQLMAARDREHVRKERERIRR